MASTLNVLALFSTCIIICHRSKSGPEGGEESGSMRSSTGKEGRYLEGDCVPELVLLVSTVLISLHVAILCVRST